MKAALNLVYTRSCLIRLTCTLQDHRVANRTRSASILPVENSIARNREVGRLIVVAVVALTVLNMPANAYPVHCYLEVNGHVYLNKICNFKPYRGGRFSIGGEAVGGYFALVDIDTAEGIARGRWNEGESHAHTDLGPLVRQSACWVNATAKICAKK